MDGVIGVSFVDLLRSEMPKEEADEYVELGFLNGLFVLGRSIELIGHYLDQKRTKGYEIPSIVSSFLGSVIFPVITAGSMGIIV